MVDELQDPQEAGSSEGDVTQKLLDASDVADTGEPQPEPEAEGEPKVEPEVTSEPEPIEQTLLADKFQTQDGLVKGYKEAEKMAHEATQKAAELQRRLDAVQQTVQPQAQQPQEVVLNPEQLTELMYSDTPKYHEYMQRQAEKRTQQMMQPLLQFASTQRTQQLMGQYPGLEETALLRDIDDLAAGRGDVGELACLIQMGRKAQELQAKARQDGANAAYATQQQKGAAQPPSGKAHPTVSAPEISPEQHAVNVAMGVSDEGFADWAKKNAAVEGK